MMRQNVTAGLIAVGLSLTAAGGCATTSARLRVATWNIAHGRGTALIQVGLPDEEFHANLERIAEVLAREKPDIVALQEADAPSSWSGRFDHVRRVQEAAGYAHRHHGLHVDAAGLDVHFGTALLSQRPLESPTSHAFGVDALDAKGFVSARVELEERPLLAVSAHLDFKSAKERRRQVDQLIDRLPGAGLPIVLLGDLNSQWDEHSAVKLLAQGLNLRAYQPERPGWETWPAHEPNRRIDWILISPELEFVDYRLWPDQISDHLAVAAVLCWRD